MREETKTEGLFIKKVVRTGYYTLIFPQDLAGGYRDGDLVLRVGSLEIPVTRQMVKSSISSYSSGRRSHSPWLTFSERNRTSSSCMMRKQ